MRGEHRCAVVCGAAALLLWGSGGIDLVALALALDIPLTEKNCKKKVNNLL